MKLKYITKPVLINFLRWLDKFKHLAPYRICYSSFRSKKDMITDVMKYYDIVEGVDKYSFNLKSSYHFLVAPRSFHFCKTTYAFQDADFARLNLSSRPEGPHFSIRKGDFHLVF